MTIKHNINPDWLLSGEGEIFLSSLQGGYTPPPDPTAQLKGKDKESARDYIEYLGDKPQIKEYIADKQEFKEWLSSKTPAPLSALPEGSTTLELLPIPKANLKNGDEGNHEQGFIHMLGNIAAGRPISVEGIHQESYTIVYLGSYTHGVSIHVVKAVGYSPF